jgi:hypothetical protein
MRVLPLLLAAVATGASPSPPVSTSSEAQAVSNAASDFDFLIGRWKVHNRRLRERLKGSAVWDEFPGTVVARPIWGGKGNVDEYQAEGPAGRIQGMTVRLFNPRSRQWSLTWANPDTGILDTPMIGGFEDGRGEFYDQELFEGRSIFVRYVWSDITPTSCRWEQAFSPDGGKSWETNWIMQFTRADSTAAEDCCAVVELRQYVTKPGRRDDLIAVFDRHFVESQERDGMRVLGQFVDRRNPDRFVWMRGFAGMEPRRKALEAFYGGPIWAEHKAVANDTMVDVSNVLLLRPARPLSGLRLRAADRPALDAPQATPGLVTATIYSFASPVSPEFKEFFETSAVPVLRDSGAALLGYFVTEASENTFPRLPVRTGENVFVWLASFADEAAYATYRTRLAGNKAWKQSVGPSLEKQLSKSEDVLELVPTRRSLLRHSIE